LSRGDAAENAAGVVRQELRFSAAAGAHFIGVLFAGQQSCRHAVADFDALDGIDRHHRRRQVGIELAVERRAPSGRYALGHHLDDGADGRARFADAV